jgi:plasminogen activator
MTKRNGISFWFKALTVAFVAAIMLILPCAPSALAQTVSTEESTEAEFTPGSFLINTKVSLGLLNGESREIVYAPEYNWKVSELIWEIDTVYMLGGEISVRPISWLGLNLEGWFAISEGDGAMDDYDWMVLGLNDWTHWSHHEETDLDKGTMLDFNFEFFPLNKKHFSLSLLAGYKRNNWKWKAYGGDFIYSYYGFRDTQFSLSDSELGITYEQWFNVPYIGVGMTAQAGPVNFQGRIIGSTMVDAEDEDHHHLRNLVFKEDFEDGDFIGIQFGASYQITPKLGVGLDIDYQNFDEMKGSTTVRDTTTGAVDYYGGDSAGTDNEITLVSLGLTYRF